MSKGPLPKPKQNKGMPWFRHAAVYQIYPRSFQDSTGNGVGDLRGIINRLDYLNDGTDQSLGVEAIWLSPIYTSPMKDFGYDVADYTAVDPLFGTMEDFEELVREAHKRGIHIIMDFIPNHCSNQHPWFLEARSSKDNPKRDWFIWADPKEDGAEPNNWISVFGGSAWEMDTKTDQYYMHSFLVDQPDLNWRNPEVKEAFQEIIDFWIHKGVDGFRTDAVYHMIKDEQLRDEPPNPNYVLGRDDPYNELLHIHTQGREELFDAINNFGALMEGHDKDLFMMTEAYVGLSELVRFYENCRAHGLIAPFNFNLLSLPWNALMYRRFVDKFEAALDEKDWPNWVLGNHDRSRVATRLGPQRSRLAALLLFTLRGMPILYYGDEIGMTDVPIPASKVQDPFEKSDPGFGLGRDPERTPMQWDASKNAGFSDGKPWLPLARNFEAHNAEAQQQDPTSILALYKQLIHLRAESPALLTGIYRSINTGNNHVFGFFREVDNQRLLVLANFSPRKQKVHITETTKARVMCNTHCDRDLGSALDLDGAQLKANEGVVLEV